METVSLKIKEEISEEIAKLSKIFHYSTKTEFIREAIRDKIKELELEMFKIDLKKFQGSAKKKISEKEFHRAREEVFEEFSKKLR